MAVLREQALAGAIVCALVMAGRVQSATAPPPSEYEVKAAFLCSFPEFVEWPTASAGPITICVLGHDPFGPLLEETVKTRAIQTKALKVQRSTRVADALGCQVVYFGASETARVNTLLSDLAGSSVLTVSDIPGFAERGGMIGFVLEEKRVRFQINVAAAERSGIRISSRLLKLARVLPTPSPNGS